MGATFRQRLASDSYFAIRISEPERHKLCPFSDKLLEQEDPDSMDFDSKIKMMNDEEFREHVRAAQQLKMDEEEQQEQQKHHQIPNKQRKKKEAINVIR